ncbi:class I SAM-dependent methyltransferase [Pseudonocardia acidicola]|uniref:Class I SAM-dependent methyltransferase n=1 Tax=Pseudonocardia acidicola TaxID=2724939 RepID=A0ABX1SKV4_9PSEU|nr:class I SAM-dependent methyltransferase [Pseudonocardia acidicola]NMI01423.1 class I SAM-dependent methyltransferase [Pseudonocardia acidicola]
MNEPTADTVTAPAWERLVGRVYDRFLWLGEHHGMRARRVALLAEARGRVLEIGAGTGLNLAHYPDAVSELLLTEPSPPMITAVRRRVAASGRDGVRVLAAPAAALPVPDGSVDTVVTTMVLCTVPDPHAALAEIVRVLRPGGRLLFCEHVLADTPRLRRWQRRLAGPWAGFAIGCRCDRPLLADIENALRVERVEHGRWSGMPALVRPLVVGVAVR